LPLALDLRLDGLLHTTSANVPDMLASFSDTTWKSPEAFVFSANDALPGDLSPLHIPIIHGEIY
jgi:hypothetical protein